MRIGFDARMIDHPGIGRYIRNLLSAMLEINTDHTFFIYGDKRNLLTTYNLQLTTANVIDWTPPIYGLKELISNPFKEDKLDLLHIPHFNVPLNIGNTKLVITIHDLIYLKFKESSSLLKRTAAKWVISKALNKADRIVAVSNNTKKDIIEYFPKAKEKIDVIHEASDPQFMVIEDARKKEEIRRKYGLTDDSDIILFVGSLKRHKNIIRLIEAYIKLKEKGIKAQLVIVGRHRPDEFEILKKIKDQGIIYLGEIPPEDLPALYNVSSLLAIPSLYEGFGLTALEAFACGIPVAASDRGSLPEVVGNAGVLFDPYDIDDICGKICSILTDENLRQVLIKKGQERVKEFSWQKTAKQTLVVYENCYSNVQVYK